MITTTQRLTIHPDRIKQIKSYVLDHPELAQAVLNAEYERHPRPRYGLITWLKRKRLHNPTVRVIPSR